VKKLEDETETVPISVSLAFFERKAPTPDPTGNLFGCLFLCIITQVCDIAIPMVEYAFFQQEGGG
jgi:hypothetical protein